MSRPLDLIKFILSGGGKWLRATDFFSFHLFVPKEELYNFKGEPLFSNFVKKKIIKILTGIFIRYYSSSTDFKGELEKSLGLNFVLIPVLKTAIFR